MIIALMLVTPSQFMIASNSSSLHSGLEELLHKAKVTIDHDITQAHFPHQRSSL